MPRVRVQFLPLGASDVPTVDLAVQHRRSGARLFESAMLDTGASVTVFSDALLRLNGFPVRQAKEDSRGLHGLGGEERLFYLEAAQIVLTDDEGGLHPINVPRLFFTRVGMPPVLGRDVLQDLGAKLYLDFVEHDGHLELG